MKWLIPVLAAVLLSAVPASAQSPERSWWYGEKFDGTSFHTAQLTITEVVAADSTVWACDLTGSAYEQAAHTHRALWWSQGCIMERSDTPDLYVITAYMVLLVPRVSVETDLIQSGVEQYRLVIDPADNSRAWLHLNAQHMIPLHREAVTEASWR